MLWFTEQELVLSQSPSDGIAEKQGTRAAQAQHSQGTGSIHTGEQKKGGFFRYCEGTERAIFTEQACRFLLVEK